MGRIIFSNFLKMPLQKYKEIIKETEKYGKSHKWQNLSLSPCVQELDSPSPAVCIGELDREHAVAEIACPVPINRDGIKSGDGFIIRYTYNGFNRIYLIDRFFEEDAGHRPILYKARHINLRNEITHRIIMGIIEGQKRFLITCDPHDLAVFYESQLGIDKSWVSRLVNRISVIIPNGEEILLRNFFQNKKDINKRFIKKIFDKECEDLESGRLESPLGDNRVRALLESIYGIKVSRRSIGIYRKEIGILKASRRGLGHGYPFMLVNFSSLYPLTIESIQDNAPNKSGVYEIHLDKNDIDYPSGRSSIIYIGSAKDIRKRLREHLNHKNKNSQIRKYIYPVRNPPSRFGGKAATGSGQIISNGVKTHNCLFRYIQHKAGWREEERRLYELFKKTYGAQPSCNRVRP